ncbi:MAG: fumarylacetoacetate hydrolase family protein [Actinomycetia bacterium]|nr:fumarylacetoacetate hydrolase family protein [Actinomycetes bacterium]
MKLARFGPEGQEVPAIELGKTWRDARSVTSDFDPTFFASGGLSRLGSAAADLPVLEVDGLRTGAPIGRPGAVLCIGMNYAAHAAESGSAPPDEPVLFLKVPNTVGGPFDDVEIPRNSVKTDWEVELGVVIGARAAYLSSPEEAMEKVAGYVTVNDLSERTFQLEISGGQWSKGKCCAGFTPVGPWFVTADEVDSGALRLQSWVNGEPRQDSSTADLIFNVGTVIHHLSQFLVLEPGDLILTGTPEGVALSGRFPYLRAGDVVEVEVEGLGRSRQVMTAFAGAAGAHHE